jgi:small-conductance mechanosensitive channel
MGRVEIPVSVSLDSDPRKVQAVLEEIARAHPSVLKNPQPLVSFAGFSPASLDFSIYLFVADITATLAITNEIKFTIIERLRAEHIPIPHPPRELIVKARGPEEMAEALLAKSGPATQTRARQPARRRKPVQK